MKFELNAKEIERYKAWEHKCKAPMDTIGSKISFTFTPTGIGTVAHAKCICGAQLCLTTFEGW